QNPDTVIGPDFAFVALERLPAVLPKGHLPLAPDLVLETRSPSDTRRMVEDKVKQWLEAGVRMVWTLDPKARTLTIHRPGEQPGVLGEDAPLTGEDLLPGLELPLHRVFGEAKR